MLRTITVLSLAAAVSLPAHARVDAAQAARLGQDLMPLGGERAGNAAGTIPSWEGGLSTPPANYQPGMHHPDPYAADQELYRVDKSNMGQYKALLTPGYQKLLEKSPDYYLRVLPTRRSAASPQRIYDATRYNATNAGLIAGGNGIEGTAAGIPFPIPQSGQEVIWNHITRYRGGNLRRSTVQAAPQANGDFTLVHFEDEVAFPGMTKGLDAKKAENALLFFKQRVTAPARLAGNVLLVHDSLDQIAEPRMAWLYNAGQRRVRRAPQVAYDGPGTAADGMRTSDNFDMYNGAPNRYDWKLVGKRELYIPYNNYKLQSPEVKYDDILNAGHTNQDLARYELHRVWEVEATLKSGERNIYAKRRFFVDEDSWQIAVSEHYDGRGQLWRVGQAMLLQQFDQQVPVYAFEALYDIIAGRYIAVGMANEEKSAVQYGIQASAVDFTPAALRNAGVR